MQVAASSKGYDTGWQNLQPPEEDPFQFDDRRFEEVTAAEAQLGAQLDEPDIIAIREKKIRGVFVDNEGCTPVVKEGKRKETEIGRGGTPIPNKAQRKSLTREEQRKHVAALKSTRTKDQSRAAALPGEICDGAAAGLRDTASCCQCLAGPLVGQDSQLTRAEKMRPLDVLLQLRQHQLGVYEAAPALRAAHQEGRRPAQGAAQRQAPSP